MSDRIILSGALGLALALALTLAAPAGAQDPSVTTDPPQFDPDDGNYAIFGGSLASELSTSSCPNNQHVACLAGFRAYYPQLGPNAFFDSPRSAFWFGGLLDSQQLSTIVDIGEFASGSGLPPGDFELAMVAVDEHGVLHEGNRQPFTWPVGDLDLNDVKLLSAGTGASHIGYDLDHDGTPFESGKVTGTLFDAGERIGRFTDRAEVGQNLTRLPGRLARKLKRGERYRLVLKAKDEHGRKAREKERIQR